MMHSDAGLQAASGVKAEAPRMRARLGRQLMTLPEQIAEHIFAAIEHGEYAPGERIREEALAEQFEVSRGPVREALRILEKDSVVDIVPNRGAHVTQLAIKEVRDIFEIRRDLIGAMVRRLDRRNTSFIASIAAGVRELETLVKEPGAGDAYLAVSDRLACLLAEGAGNERLAAILGSLARQTRRYSRLGLATAARRQQSALTWRMFLKTLTAGEVGSAVAALESLIDASMQEAVRQLQAAGNVARTKDLLQ
ncbi:GntR family transcriptional regulator [Paraburkholderia sediminicola]|uniref:GntR family transcriptional regulator n=1 Tax=Paraburkholderia sediminicola TaxID=458836 RepID=UPI0038B84611